ncbi:MAG: recombinase RecJ, partial [Lachnospiraceae bacterium]|nr:recombinase RecJ [Lachnospiraceae bacterium]
MTLKDLEQYEQITIQCHDNPDADALAAGYGLYCYFSDKGKKVDLVYSGKNEIQKANLCIMI